MEGTGLVLAGGGGKGIYQIGMIKSLIEAGLMNDIVAVSGTSIGGVNAVLFSEGLAEGGLERVISQMEEAWNDIDYKVFFNTDPTQLQSGDSHFSRNETERLIDKYLDYSLFTAVSDSEGDSSIKTIPTFLAAAACPPNIITSSQIEYFSLQGKDYDFIKNAVLATTALPVIYNPAEVEGKLYVDGGVKDNVPIKPLYDMGLRRFIVIELSTKSDIKNPEQFADAEIIDILPSHELGRLLSGTMNFDKEDLGVKKELGVRDGRRYVKTLFEKDDIYINLERELAARDYEDIMKNMRFERTYNTLDKDISSRFDYINDIESKYGL